MANKWKQFFGKNYRLLNLGRPAVFLLPAKKLKKKFRKSTVEKDLHKFLRKKFGSYTKSTVPSFGFWRNSDKATISDKCQEYEVSFVGKRKIPILIRKLAEVAKVTNEDCIYLKAGQYSCLVYPNRKTAK